MSLSGHEFTPDCGPYYVCDQCLNMQAQGLMHNLEPVPGTKTLGRKSYQKTDKMQLCKRCAAPQICAGNINRAHRGSLPGCNNAVSLADSPSRCECMRIFCNDCCESNKQLTTTTCCRRIYCGFSHVAGGQRYPCEPDPCSWCGKCWKCITPHRQGMYQYKECSALNCFEKICYECCRSIFNKDLRYCKPCLHANGKHQILKISDQLKPRSATVKGMGATYKATSAKFDATK